MELNAHICRGGEAVVLISRNVVDGHTINCTFEDDDEDVDLSCSFASIGTSACTEYSIHPFKKPSQAVGSALQASYLDNSVDHTENDFDILECVGETGYSITDRYDKSSSVVKKESRQFHTDETLRLSQLKKPYFDRTPRIYESVSAAQLQQDKQRIAADNQNKLNNFILKEQTSLAIDRHDHLIMLRQLIGVAYFADSKRAEHRPKWKKILAEVRKEYWGAHAIFNLSPDPYQNVIAKLSSMMLWNKELQNWTYTYHEAALLERQKRQAELIQKLNDQQKLFVRPE